jgi:hypothetical protein
MSGPFDPPESSARSGHGPEDAMKPANPGVKLTYDDFVLFPEDGRRHELIDGEHYVTPSPNRKHQSIIGNLYFLLRAHLQGRDAGRVFIATSTSSSHCSM